MTQAGALEILIRGLESTGARYLIGGSVASSVHGLPRTTLDTDLLVQLGPLQIDALARTLGSDWYVDTQLARECIENGRAFNVIQMTTGYKFDLFPATSEFHVSELQRASVKTLAIPGETLLVSSPLPRIWS